MDDMMNQSSKNVFISLNLSSRDFVQWILSQCRGLVEALAAIHQVDVVPKSDEDPLPAKLETLGYTLISNQPTFSTSAKIQPVTHLEFLKLQTLVSPSFTVYHLGRERAVVLRTDARKNTAPPNTTSAILYQGKWIYGHLAVSSLKSSPGGFSNMKHAKNSAERERGMPCFQEIGSTSKMALKTILRITFSRAISR